MKIFCVKERIYIFMFNVEGKVWDELVSFLNFRVRLFILFFVFLFLYYFYEYELKFNLSKGELILFLFIFVVRFY